MRNGHVAMRGQVLLTKSPKSFWERKKERESKRREMEKERVLEREAPPSL